MEESERGEGFVQSLARGLSVIRAFRPGYEKLTMAEVASHAVLTRAGARRVLLTLKELGYVGTEGRNFFLTSRVLDLSQGYLRQTLWDKVRPALQSISDAINETASAGVLEGYDVVYTLRVRSARILHWELDVGAHLPAHASSMGRVLLAELPAVELNKYLQQATFTRFTKFTATDPDVLRGVLKEVRQQGWCTIQGEIDEGLRCIAVPLTDRKGRTLAAIGVSMNCDRASQRRIKSEILPLLKRASASITTSL